MSERTLDDIFRNNYILEPDHTTRRATGKDDYLAFCARGMDAKRVAEDTVGDYWVSTVFLTHDHRFWGGGPPLLFETMVFPNDDTYSDLHCERYSNWDAALAGHERVVAALRDGREPGTLHEVDDES